MAKSRSVRVEIIVDAKGAVKGVRMADGSIKSLDKTVSNAGKSVFNMGRAFDVALGSLVAKGAAAAAASLQRLVRAGFNFLNQAVQGAGIQDIADRKLEQALLNTGDASEESAKKLKDLASEVQRGSNFGDEAIITAQAMLLSFQEVGGADGAELLTTRMADMAAGVAKVSGETLDLNQIAALLGKALTTGASALKRVGVSLTEAQEKAFNAAKGLDKVRLLTEVIDSNFKGLAVTIADPFKQIQNSAGDLQEEIGKQLLPLLRSLALELRDFADSEKAKEIARQIGETLAKALQTLVTFIRDNQGEIIRFFKGVGALGSDVSNLVKSVSDLSSSLSDFDGEGGFEALSVSEIILSPLVLLNETLEFINKNIRVLTGVLKGAGEGAAILKDLFTGESKQFTTDMKEAAIALDSMLLEGHAAGFDAMFAAAHSAIQPVKGLAAETKNLGEVLDETAQKKMLAFELSGISDTAEEEREALKKLEEAHEDLAFTVEEQAERRIEAHEKVLRKEQDAREEEIRQIDVKIEGLRNMIAAEEARQGAMERSIELTSESAFMQAESAKDVLSITRQVIKALLAEAVARSITKALASVPFPFNIIAAAVAGAAAGALFEAAVPKFRSGVTNFGGGIAQVHKDEIISLPKGSSVTSQVQSRRLLSQVSQGADSALFEAAVPKFRSGVTNFGGGIAQVHKDEIISLPRGSSVTSQVQSRRLLRQATGGTAGGGVQHVTVSVRLESDIPQVVTKIQQQIDSNRRTGVGAKSF